MPKQLLLFLIIFIEGYVVLATELLAIRGLVPFVGSGIEVVSIVIGSVLLPLALGYSAGGQRLKREQLAARESHSRPLSIRRMLERNLMIALVILTVGLSYPLQYYFFMGLEQHLTRNRIILSAIYSVTFLIIPTYLLAQTVPMISNYFSRARLSEITGRMLFFSTAGSFFGSIVSTLLLMTLLGVHNTVTITLLLIALLVVLVSPRKRPHIKYFAAVIALCACAINSDMTMKHLGIIADTPYSLVKLIPLPNEDARILSINHSWSSKYAPDPKNRFSYIQYIDRHFITPLAGKEKRNILVLGAGGFVLGWDDRENSYTFVDIDAAMKDIAEHHYLPAGGLPENKHFVATSARSFLRSTEEKYDLVVVDVFSNIMSIPMEAITREFMQSAKAVLKPNGALVANVISSPNYDDRFSVRYYNTFASVFPVFDREVLSDYSAWEENVPFANTIYIYHNTASINEDRTVYTDDKNTYSLDH